MQDDVVMQGRYIVALVWALAIASLTVDTVLIVTTDRSAIGAFGAWGLAGIAVAAVSTLVRKINLKAEQVLEHLKQATTQGGDDSRQKLRALR